ncbi:hypothetical protein [Quadrisphaera granulorum]|nr:hypothetical protein [Quadrisphaera granulorum]
MRLHPGEIEVGGWQVTTLTDFVQRLVAASPEISGRPRIVAIDGRGGTASRPSLSG